jgi:hypothetical protein
MERKPVSIFSPNPKALMPVSGAAPHFDYLAGGLQPALNVDTAARSRQLIEKGITTARGIHFKRELHLPWEDEKDGKLFSTPTEALKYKINWLRKQLGFVPLNYSEKLESSNQFLMKNLTNLTPEQRADLKNLNTEQVQITEIRNSYMHSLAALEADYAVIIKERDFQHDLANWIMGDAPDAEYEKCFWVDKAKLKGAVTPGVGQMFLGLWSNANKPDIDKALEKQKMVSMNNGLMFGKMLDRADEELMATSFLTILSKTPPKNDEEAHLFFKYIVKGAPIDWDWKSCPRFVRNLLDPEHLQDSLLGRSVLPYDNIQSMSDAFRANPRANSTEDKRIRSDRDQISGMELMDSPDEEVSEKAREDFVRSLKDPYGTLADDKNKIRYLEALLNKNKKADGSIAAQISEAIDVNTGVIQNMLDKLAKEQIPAAIKDIIGNVRGELGARAEQKKEERRPDKQTLQKVVENEEYRKTKNEKSERLIDIVSKHFKPETREKITGLLKTTILKRNDEKLEDIFPADESGEDDIKALTRLKRDPEYKAFMLENWEKDVFSETARSLLDRIHRPQYYQSVHVKSGDISRGPRLSYRGKLTEAQKAEEALDKEYQAVNAEYEAANKAPTGIETTDQYIERRRKFEEARDKRAALISKRYEETAAKVKALGSEESGKLTFEDLAYLHDPRKGTITAIKRDAKGNPIGFDTAKTGDDEIKEFMRQGDEEYDKAEEEAQKRRVKADVRANREKMVRSLMKIEASQPVDAHLINQFIRRQNNERSRLNTEAVSAAAQVIQAENIRRLANSEKPLTEEEVGYQTKRMINQMLKDVPSTEEEEEEAAVLSPEDIEIKLQHAKLEAQYKKQISGLTEGLQDVKGGKGISPESVAAVAAATAKKPSGGEAATDSKGGIAEKKVKEKEFDPMSALDALQPLKLAPVVNPFEKPTQKLEEALTNLEQAQGQPMEVIEDLKEKIKEAAAPVLKEIAKETSEDIMAEKINAATAAMKAENEALAAELAASRKQVTELNEKMLKNEATISDAVMGTRKDMLSKLQSLGDQARSAGYDIITITQIDDIIKKGSSPSESIGQLFNRLSVLQDRIFNQLLERSNRDRREMPLLTKSPDENVKKIMLELDETKNQLKGAVNEKLATAAQLASTSTKMLEKDETIKGLRLALQEAESKQVAPVVAAPVAAEGEGMQKLLHINKKERMAKEIAIKEAKLLAEQNKELSEKLTASLAVQSKLKADSDKLSQSVTEKTEAEQKKAKSYEDKLAKLEKDISELRQAKQSSEDSLKIRVSELKDALKEKEDLRLKMVSGLTTTAQSQYAELEKKFNDNLARKREADVEAGLKEAKYKNRIAELEKTITDKETALKGAVVIDMAQAAALSDERLALLRQKDEYTGKLDEVSRALNYVKQQLDETNAHYQAALMQNQQLIVSLIFHIAIL